MYIHTYICTYRTYIHTYVHVVLTYIHTWPARNVVTFKWYNVACSFHLYSMDIADQNYKLYKYVL